MKDLRFLARLQLLLVLLLIAIVPSLAFAEVPAKQGFVLDNGAMLTDSEISSLEAEIERAPFSLYLYTLDNIRGTSMEEIAKQIYQHWELAGSDVLLMIAKQEREVHIEIATGSSFDKAIMEAPGYGGTNQHTKFLDDAFVPYAIDGDFRQATLSVITQLQRLRDSMEAGQIAPGATSSDSDTSGVDGGVVSRDDVVAGRGGESDSGGSGANINMGVYIAVIGSILIALAAYIYSRRRTLFGRKQQLLLDYQALLGSIHSIEQELSPMVRLSQGKSQEYLKKLQDRFYHLLQEASQQLAEVERLKIPMWVTMRQIQAIDYLDKIKHTYETASTEIKDGIKQYKVMETTAINVLKQAKQKWDVLHTELQAQKSQVGYPLDILDKKCMDIKQVLQECEHVITFDPESVTTRIQEMPERILKLQNEIVEIKTMLVVSREMPDTLQKVRDEMDKKVQQEGLLLVEIKPFAFYEHVQESLQRLQEALQKGDVEVSQSIIATIESWLADGQQKIENTIRAREWNQRTIAQVKEEVGQYEQDRIRQLNTKLESLKERYTENHWRDIPGKIERITNSRPIIVSQLSEAEKLASSDEQKYFAAEKLLQAAVESLEEMANIASYIASLEMNLDRQYEQMTATISQNERELERAKERSSQLFSPDIQKFSEQMAQLIHQTRISLLQNPRNLDDSSTLLQEVESSYAQVEQAIASELQKKQRAEKRASDFQQLSQSAVKKCRSYVAIARYEQELTRYHSDVQKAIETGQYATVYAVVEKGKAIIREMEKEYLVKREQERHRQEADLQKRRRMAATLNRASRPSSVGTRGGGSGFSTRGSSGGGSSFRSSGSRGSSSSFRSGGSRGGGSKW